MSLRPDDVHHRHSVGRDALARGAAMLGLALALGTMGCRTPPVSLGQGYRNYTTEDYSEVLKRWTRKTQTFSLQQTDELLTVESTYMSWDFRWAYAERYATDYQLGNSERETLRESMLRQSSNTHEFYVTLYGTSIRWVDLHRPTTAWIVRLVDESGAITSPSDIEPVKKPGALEKRYFPYTTPYRNVFRIRFPRIANDGKRPSIAPDAHWMALRFSGPQGRGELRWDIEPAAAAAPTSPPESPAAAGK